MIAPADFQHRLFQWFDRHGRKHLPWQQAISPYRVWVSEIMLQQTQVNTVIPYFERFMDRFPTVESLAEAPEDAVLQHWSGLGYYARARNLHKAAQQVVAEHDGRFPDSVDALAALPGIGRSTAGAIASISMGITAPILDGNVKRVLTRLHAVEGWPGLPKVADQLWQIAERFTPAERTGDYTQAMMDLGATLCTRSKPACGICPFMDVCQARIQSRQAEFPQSKAKKALPERATWMLMLQTGDEILLYKRPQKGIWGGLWSFPEFTTIEDLDARLALDGLRVASRQDWQPFRHTFSHYHLDIHPVRVELERRPELVGEGSLMAGRPMEGAGQVWYNRRLIHELGLAAPVRKLIDQLLQEIP